MSYSLVLLLKTLFYQPRCGCARVCVRTCVCVCIDFLFFSLFFCSSQSEEKTNEASAVSYQEKIRQKFIFMYQWIEICLCSYASLHLWNKTERKPRLTPVEAVNHVSKTKQKENSSLQVTQFEGKNTVNRLNFLIGLLPNRRTVELLDCFQSHTNCLTDRMNQDRALVE